MNFATLVNQSLRSLLFAILSSILLASVAPFVSAESKHLATDLRALREKIEAADQRSEWSSEKNTIQEYLRLAPDNPRLLLRLVRVELRLGELGAARNTLDRFISLGLILDASKEPEISTLLVQRGFSQQRSRLRRNERPIGMPRALASLGQQPLVAEGIAYDAPNQRILISAVAMPAILQVAVDGRSQAQFLAEPVSSGPFGIAIDPDRGFLWAAEASGHGIPNSTDQAETALIQVNLVTGKIVRRYALAADLASAHQLNDVVVALDHTVYIADATSGEVYKLVPSSERLEGLVPKGDLMSAQGMTITRDQRALLVADYGTGLRRVDLRTGTISLLRSRKPAALVGIDGLTTCGNALIATQNGTRPERVLKIELDAAMTSVKSVAVLAQNTLGVHDITLGTCIGEHYVYLSDSQWAGFNSSGTQVASALSSPLVVELSVGSSRH